VPPSPEASAVSRSGLVIAKRFPGSKSQTESVCERDACIVEPASPVLQHLTPLSDKEQLLLHYVVGIRRERVAWRRHLEEQPVTTEDQTEAIPDPDAYLKTSKSNNERYMKFFTRNVCSCSYGPLTGNSSREKIPA